MFVVGHTWQRQLLLLPTRLLPQLTVDPTSLLSLLRAHRQPDREGSWQGRQAARREGCFPQTNERYISNLDETHKKNLGHYVNHVTWSGVRVMRGPGFTTPSHALPHHNTDITQGLNSGRSA